MPDIHEIFQKHLAEHPVCERCKSSPSVAITRWGTIQAACKACLEREMEEFAEANTPKPTGVECYRCGEPYLFQSARVDECSKCRHIQVY